MRSGPRSRVNIASRYSDIVIGDRGDIDPAGVAPMGRLAGVVVVAGVVYCRWQTGPGQVLVTASSDRNVGHELVAKRAEGNDVVLLGVRHDGTSLTNLTKRSTSSVARKQPKSRRETIQ